MKRINNKILSIVVFGLVVLFGSCQRECPKSSDVPPVVSPDKVNSLSVARVEVELHEGHSHAPENARQKIGSVMWSSQFGGGYFHGNPFNEDMKFPLKRQQKMSYNVDKDGNVEPADKSKDYFNILSTTPRKKYVNGVMNALIVKLYDAQGNRIDNKLKTADMQKRVQVFYEVVDVEPSFSKYKLPEKYDKTDICYYWYYDRMPSDRDDYGDYITDKAVGFRGVIQSLEPHTKFKLRMIVTLLPENQTKEAALRNSISPSAEQLKNTVFTMDIPIRVVTEYPNFESKAEEIMGKDFYDMNESELEEFQKKCEELEELYFEEIREVFPTYTIEELKKLQKDMYNIPGESSQFYL